MNPKLLQPFVASICKVMAVKKPCVIYDDSHGTFLGVAFLKYSAVWFDTFSIQSLGILPHVYGWHW